MKDYDPSNFHRKIARAQTQDSAVLPGLTVRDEANALIVGAVRHDPFFEHLHAGKAHPALEDPTVSRITNDEMRRLMIRWSAVLAWLLDLRDRDPVEYARQITFFGRYSQGWEREATGAEADDPRG